ncbi:unannotated protein [freshwater metagenome]|uniref:Unannotated protein n=1 Tax=freshwater metagenome TaxID=449393 RepID=A0A6J7INR8_9ZZZZ
MTSPLSQMSELACVTGRFQPVHRQHMELFEVALAEAEHLIVAVTNPDIQARQAVATSLHRHSVAANPFTYFERVQLLKSALDAAGHLSRTTIVPFDLTRPEVWADYVPRGTRQFVRAYSDWERQKAGWLRDAGYRVTLLEGDAQQRISSTDIREFLTTHASRGSTGPSEEWHELVPTSTIALLERLWAAADASEREL